VVSGLVAPTAPDNHRWETLWHYLQSGPGIFKGDLHFYKVDGDIRGKIDEIDGKAANLHCSPASTDYSCTTEGTLDMPNAPGASAHHHEGARPFPMSRGPAEVHLLSIAGAGEDTRAGVNSRQSENAMSHAEAVHTLQPPAPPGRSSSSQARSATTRCRRTPDTTHAVIFSIPSA